jgi:cyclic dehypoxanthinyl futalosine synthase
MMFGSVETLEDRVAHMRAIRDLQDETGGFRAFIPWSFQSGRTELEGQTEQATGVDYLMTLAVSRLYLDNVPHIQASWVTQGLKIGQVALRFGADDIGSTMIEENVVAATGLRVEANRDDLVHAIRTAGFVPAQRRTDYSIVRTFATGD